MGIESYNFILFPIGDEAFLGEDGWEIEGNKFVSFSEVQKNLEKINGIEKYLSKDTSDDLKECYYAYNDGQSIIEFEINCGEFEKEIQEISVRFALCNPVGTYEKAVKICEILSNQIGLNVLDVRASQVLDFNSRVIMHKSKKFFEQKKRDFFKFFKLPYGAISEPLNCGKQVMERLRKGLE